VRTGTSVVDLTTGANAVQGILAALFVRERTGQGQRVDVSLLGSVVSWMTYHAVAYLATGELPPRMGSRHPSVAPYGAFPTRDGYLVVAVALDSSWKRFCQALERPDLIEDPRFAKNPDRIANRAEMEALLTEILAARGAAEWGEIMDRHGVPCSPINSLDTVLALPQVLQQELVIDLPREDIPDLRNQAQRYAGGGALGAASPRGAHRRGAVRIGVRRGEDRRVARLWSGLAVGVETVVRPARRIVVDIGLDACEVGFGADDVVVVAALPEPAVVGQEAVFANADAVIVGRNGFEPSDDFRQ
jgi:crotonobetainyl-CoA:carnitine CoA-transferase CaiB-like acyl-CoA transferase